MLKDLASCQAKRRKPRKLPVAAAAWSRRSGGSSTPLDSCASCGCSPERTGRLPGSLYGAPVACASRWILTHSHGLDCLRGENAHLFPFVAGENGDLLGCRRMGDGAGQNRPRGTDCWG